MTINLDFKWNKKLQNNNSLNSWKKNGKMDRFFFFLILTLKTFVLFKALKQTNKNKKNRFAVILFFNCKCIKDYLMITCPSCLMQEFPWQQMSVCCNHIHVWLYVFSISVLRVRRVAAGLVSLHLFHPVGLNCCCVQQTPVFQKMQRFYKKKKSLVSFH